MTMRAEDEKMCCRNTYQPLALSETLILIIYTIISSSDVPLAHHVMTAEAAGKHKPPHTLGILIFPATDTGMSDKEAKYEDACC